MRRLSALVFLYLFSSAAFCQQYDIQFKAKNFKNNPEGLKFALEKIKEGDTHIQNGEFQAALPFFLSADSVNPNCADLNVKIGVCYLNSTIKNKCLRYFEKAHQIQTSILTHYRESKRMSYFMGRGYQLNYQWDSAIMEYNLALKKPKKQEVKEINKYIDECNNGKALMATPVKTRLENMGTVINCPFNDTHPLLTADGNEIVFTSQRESNTSTTVDPQTGLYTDDIYISQYVNGQWSLVEGLEPPVNTIDDDESLYLTPDGKTLYIWRYTRGSDIYCTHYGSKGWSDPVPLSDSINSIYSETSMCLSPDGKTIFFTSDRPGGFGGKDIYTAKLGADSTWGSPVNLGGVVNTEYDEEGVYMNPDGKTLYFSSRGHSTMGGFDIFMTVRDSNGSWSEPKNLGYPINTPDDDVYFSVSSGGRFGYISRVTDSNMLDIYRVSMDAYMPPEWVYKGTITDSANGMKLKVAMDFTDKGNSAKSPFGDDTINGEYSLTMMANHQYTIKLHATGYKDFSTDISVPDTTTFREIDRNIVMVKLPPVPKMSDTCVPALTIIMHRFEGDVKDSGVVINAISKMNSGICLKNMQFAVQVGAFKSLKKFDYARYGIKKSDVHKFDYYYNPVGPTDTVTHITVGSFTTYEEAKDYKEKLIKKGLKDAFIVGFCDEKLVDLKHLIHP